MSDAPELLRRAADALESYVVPEAVNDIAALMALHILRATSGRGCPEEARLLCAMIDRVR